MAQSLAQIYVHGIFCAAGRRTLIRPPAIRRELHRYMGGVLRGLGAPAEVVGGADNHVHVLFRLPRTKAIADIMRDLKQASSKWLGHRLSGPFAWQKGYAAFSVSMSGVDDVRRYVSEQEDHHSRFGYRQELLALLRRYNVDYDERYLFD